MIDYGKNDQQYARVNTATAALTPMGTTFTYAFTDPIGHRVACYHAQSAGVSSQGYAYAMNVDYEIIKFDPNWTSTSSTPPCEYVVKPPSDAGSNTRPPAQVTVAGEAIILLTSSVNATAPMYRIDPSTKGLMPFQVTYNGQALNTFGPRGIKLGRIAGTSTGDLIATAYCDGGYNDCGFIQKPAIQVILTIDSVTGAIKLVTPNEFVESNTRVYFYDTSNQKIYKDVNNGILNTMTVDAAGNIYCIARDSAATQQFLNVFASDGRLIRAVAMSDRYFSIPGIFFRD